MIHVPSPLADWEMECRLVEVLSAFDSGVLRWDPVSSRRFDGWLGVRFGVESLWVQRPWTFDVVSEPVGDVEQPLLVSARADVVVVEIEDRSRPGVAARMVCDLPVGVDEVEVPAEAWPSDPWRVEVRTGWSTAAVAAAVHGWIVERTGRQDLLVADGAQDPGTRPISALVDAEVAAWERLASWGSDDAMVVMTLLEAFVEALNRSEGAP